MQNTASGTAQGYTITAMITYALIITCCILIMMHAIQLFKEHRYAWAILCIALIAFGIYEPILVFIAMILTAVQQFKNADQKHGKISVILAAVLIALLLFMQTWSMRLSSDSTIQTPDATASAEP